MGWTCQRLSLPHQCICKDKYKMHALYEITHNYHIFFYVYAAVCSECDDSKFDDVRPWPFNSECCWMNCCLTFASFIS